MLIDKLSYRQSLADLWHNVFGDGYDYINLIFEKDYNDSIICFGEIDNNEVVSSFYLLRTTLKFKSENFTGYYLYAAATRPSYRGKGLMGKLIREAQLYCERQGYDFISLVPSEESLYSYYQRYGFVSSMYRYDIELQPSDAVVISGDDYYEMRSSFDMDYFNFDKHAFSYAVRSLSAYGANFYKDKNNVFSIVTEEGEVIEQLPFGTALSKKIPFGMMFPINKKLDRKWNYTDLYMNIALD